MTNTVTTDQLIATIKTAAKFKASLYLKRSAGLGVTSVITNEFPRTIEVRLSMFGEPGSLYQALSHIKFEEGTQGVLLLDEYDSASRFARSGANELMAFRTLGPWTVPANVVVVGAGAGDIDHSPTANRTVLFEIN